MAKKFTLGDILRNPAAKALLEKFMPGLADNPLLSLLENVDVGDALGQLAGGASGNSGAVATSGAADDGFGMDDMLGMLMSAMGGGSSASVTPVSSGSSKPKPATTSAKPKPATSAKPKPAAAGTAQTSTSDRPRMTKKKR